MRRLPFATHIVERDKGHSLVGPDYGGILAGVLGLVLGFLALAAFGFALRWFLS